MENLDNEKILTEAKDEASSCKDMPSLMNSKAKYLGKKGPLTSLFAQMKNIPNEQKKAFGQRINEIKEKLAFIFDEQKKLIEERKLNERLEKETIDVTLPGHSYGKGSEHPFEKVVKKIEDFFVGYGYEVKDGPEVETDYFNFECLNIPKDHPARDMQDSFFISEGMLLRSHTSPVQARVMQAKDLKLPLKVICPGKVYRRDNDIPYSWGTAVNVMPMVFGNLNNESGTGVAFTRDPATGENKLMGEFLINAQGEDVVAGVRTPMPIAQMEKEFPEAYADFIKVCDTLENHYHDMQDMEFTVENKKLYMLQCRNGKRTAQAALKIACDLVDEGHKTEAEAVAMIDPRNLDTLLHPQFDTDALKKATPIGKGLGASPGAACGKVVFTADDAVEWNEKGEKVVLVRLETSPEDITGMKASQGILTVRGGMTSHAAVVARGMGTCCVSGCGDINMDEENKKFTLAGKEYHEGDYISIDGSTGNIYDGVIPTKDATIAGEFGRIMGWADKFRKLKVRTNADTPADAKKARELGAEGIGLCRTEHMFFEEDRIAAFREMICSDTAEEREAALEKILPYQQGDFEKLYEALEGCPVTIRFLDPPLHEFVPTEEEDIKKLADAQGKSVEQIKAIIASLHEFNPMMGHRGLRLAVTYPEIAKMQTKAVIRAAINVQKAHPDWTVAPEIMIPLSCDAKELKYVKDIVVATADAEIAAAGSDMKYEVGTMIEIPRAALTAGDIAKEAEFFCFGTNDLTQMTYGFSRDDAGKFLNAYYDAKIFESDPFAKLDQTGVGQLMEMAVKNGKATRPELHCGICGEHGGDPSSVEFCHKIGLDYVSCSPFRVPIARLAAAQAAIAEM